MIDEEDLVKGLPKQLIKWRFVESWNRKLNRIRRKIRRELGDEIRQYETLYNLWTYLEDNHEIDIDTPGLLEIVRVSLRDCCVTRWNLNAFLLKEYGKDLPISDLSKIAWASMKIERDLGERLIA